MKRTILTAWAAALLITSTANGAHARGWGGVVGGIIAGAIIAHNYRHTYRPRYYAPRPRVYHHHHYHAQPGYASSPPVRSQPLPAPTR